MADGSQTPTSPGWYWARFSTGDPEKWKPVEVVWKYLSERDRRELDDHSLTLYSMWMRVDHESIVWGPRIPEPWELLMPDEEAKATEICRLIDDGEFESARRQIADLDAQLERRTGLQSHPKITYLSTYLAFEAEDEVPQLRSCTCVGTCKGSSGLAPGWQCALEAGRALTPSGQVDTLKEEDR